MNYLRKFGMEYNPFLKSKDIKIELSEYKQLLFRLKHLEEIKEHGIKMLTPHLGDFTVENLKAYDMEQYTDIPDVVFVCVKGYSMDDITPFLQRICDEHTIVLPILNIYGTGGRLQEKLPDSCVLDGCIYIAAQIEAPGTIKMNGNIFRIVYGARRGQEIRKELFEIKQVLEDAGITPVRISVNFSRKHLTNPRLAEDIFDIIDEL